MSDLFDSGFIKKLQNLVLNSRLVLADGAGGNRKSRSKGSSVEFSDYREYTTGDDFRRVDWNAYGRFEKLFVKLFMEEREALVHIFIDSSKSMDWGEPNKSFAARRLAAALGYISLANYDRVSLISVSNTVEKSRLSLRGRNSFAEVLDFLERMEHADATDLYSAVKASNIKSSRGISIIISDLFSGGSLTDVIKYLLYRKQEVFVCHVLSPQEIEPAIDNALRLVDKETGSYMDVSSTSLLLKTYSRVFDSFVSELEEACFKYGVNYIRMSTAMPVEQMIKSVVDS